MSKLELPRSLAPCGLNCGWCVYRKTGETDDSGCPGCGKREICPIRDCAKEEGHISCNDCLSFPCYVYLQGYQCVKDRSTF